MSGPIPAADPPLLYAGGAVAPKARPATWARFSLSLRVDGWTAGTVAVALVLAAPVLVVLSSFLQAKGEIWRHLADTVLGEYIANTGLLLAGVLAGTAVIGTGTAWLVTMCRFPGRRLFEWALLLPLAVPAYLLAYTYAGLFDFAGPVQTALRGVFGAELRLPEIRSLPGAILVLTLVLYPYVYLIVRAAFLAQSVCVLEAARTLGRGPWRAFTTVALPLARPAIAAGAALAGMEALADFGAVQHFAVDTFTTGIFRAWFGLRDGAAAAQLGGVLTLFALVLLTVERASRGERQYHHTTGRWRVLPRFALGRAGAAAAVLCCALPVALGFLLPAGAMAVWAFDTALAAPGARILLFARNSIVLAALTATLATALAVCLAYAVQWRPAPGSRFAVRVAGLGYAVPGTVIAIGLLMPLSRLDDLAGALLGDGAGTAALVTGSLAALVFAYLVRFLAVALGTVESGFGRLTPAIDGAARTLGCGRFGAARRVHVPLLRGSLLTAFLLVFVDTMKELPATVILRPFDFDTLAIRAYQLARDELLREAAGPGLAIVAFGILPVLLLSRQIARSRPGTDPS